MKKNIVHSLMLIGVAFFILTACSDEELSPSVSANNSPVTLSLNVQGEKKVEINTRALDETSLHTVWVAVVHDDKTVECRNFTTINNDKVVVTDIRINEGDTLHVFANTEVTSVPVDVTQEELLKHFTCTQEQVDNGRVMMYGKFPEKAGDKNSQNISVNLYRVPAKVTVKSEVEGLAVTQFKVCRVPKAGYVSYTEGYPDPDITSSSLVVIDPNMAENPAYFIPRKNNSNLGIQENTCLLVQLDGKQGWYRLDFYLGTEPVTNSTTVKFEDIVRNNWYNFTIKSVKSDGYETEKEALANIGSNIVYKMDVSSSQGVSTNGQYSLITDRDEIVVVDGSAAVVISALLTSDIELSTYKVKLVCPSGQLELVDASKGEKDFLSGGATLKKSDNSKHTVQIQATGGDLSDSYLECRLGNIVKKIPIILATANCYKVNFNTPGTKVSISILQANSDGTVRISGSNVTPVFIWADRPVAESNLEMVYNETSKSIDVINKASYSGNIIIGASVDGKIKWSWHLWCLAPGENIIEKPALGYVWMDRALGAYDLNDVDGCGGLLYQHGRKDPFVGLTWAASIGNQNEPSIYYYETPFKMTESHPYFNESCIQVKNEINNIAFAISHPYVFIQGNNVHISGSGQASEADFDWVTNTLEERNKTLDLWTKNDEKTIYDPCPYGWKVPQGHTSGPFAGLLLGDQELGDTYCSWPELGNFYYTAVRMSTGALFHHTSYSSKGLAVVRWAEVFAHLGAANATLIGENYLRYRERDITRAFGATIRCVKEK